MSSSDGLVDADRDVSVLCGPTGAGKSVLAMRLAEQFGLSIVVADSRQIYRGFDIGTAKPSPADRRAVAHYCLDVADPRDRYSAAAWVAEAERAIARSDDAGGTPLVVGGTGFYLRSLFAPLFEEPLLDAARRQALADMLARKSRLELARWAATLDPPRAHLGRSQLLRAIEIALLTGRRLSDLHRERARHARRTARYLVVDPGDALAGQLADRIEAMLSEGWVEEVMTLMQSVPDDAPAWNATGYRIVRRLARGETTLGAARDAILVETRQYAKRQRTWFRHQLPPASLTRLDPRAPDAALLVERWWRARPTETEESR